MRYPTLELGAGSYRDPDIDYYNDIKDLPGLHYHCDARELPVEDSTFSIVTSNQLIEHLDEEQQGEFLRECHRVLVAGGLLFTWTPDRGWMDKSLARYEMTQEWYDTLLAGAGSEEEDKHRRVLKQGELVKMLGEAGFWVRSIGEVGGSIECIAVKNG